MKEINLRKPWWRFVSVVLSLVMTITLLSGCGPATGKKDSQQAKSNIESTEIKEEKLSKETQENIHATNRELVESNETVEALLNQLEEQLQEDSVDLATESIQALEDALAKTEKQTNEWLAAQKKAGDELSEGTAALLAERNATFEKEIAEKEQQAETLLADLKEALNNENTQEAEKLASELENLLIEEQEPKTYGDTLPGEATVYEPEVVELDSEEADTTEASVTETQNTEGDENDSVELLSEEALSDLLVTKEDTELNEELIQLTNELGTPLAVYNYLKNNINYEYYYGSRKGAAGTYAALGGNDLDQASLLIAMLRQLDIEAQYVRGTIHLDEEQATTLTGADTISHAADVLAAAGTPVGKLTLDGEVVAIAMEHVWVRAHIPYTDYRGAGKAAGERVWIDLDTSIKAYEEVENIYDILDEEGFLQEAKELVEAGDVAAMETLLEKWETELSDRNLDNVYARKRIIKQEELSYLPLSLQYTVTEELETFAHTDREDKDAVSFLVGGESLGSYTSSELAGKDILLSFRPVSDADAEILNSYDSIFDVPAHSVYLKPVLLINGEVVSEGENIGTTLGTSQTFTMTLHSGGNDTVVDNPVTTGSMYAVTLDNQSITGEELQRVYDEAAALKDTVTEANVYSEAYLGKLLALAGKLYFAQVDIADTIAAEIYDVNQTRSLSEGITGYEVQTTSLYGVTTGISEGSLYIDVDTDSHSVVSLDGEEDTPKEYMYATGMISSLYESVVWEELTGIESVSTISILANAQEEDIDILLISKNNLDTEIEKLNTDEATKQTVINAVNSGKIVTIPAEDITMGDWHGTGYIITNPETGAGAYMISGALNGGSTSEEVDEAYMANIILSVIEMVEGILLIIALMSAGVSAGIVLLGCIPFVLALKAYAECFSLYYAYICGDVEAGEEIVLDAKINAILMVVFGALGLAAKPLINAFFKSKLVRELGEDLAYRLMNHFDDATDCYKFIKQLRNAGVADDVIKEAGEKYGKEGLEFAAKAKKYGVDDDIVKKMLGKNSLDNYTDDVLEFLGKHPEYADDILSWIDQYGKKITDAIAKHRDDIIDIFIKHGDDAIEVIAEHGDEAVDGFKNGKALDEIIAPTKPTLSKGSLPKGDYAEEVSGGLIRQNRAAQVLAENGYDVTMLKEDTKGSGKGNGYGITSSSNPDFMIEGRVFDCYSPDKQTSTKTIVRQISRKTTTQARRIILNLEAYELDVNVLKKELLSKTNGDLKYLNELIVIKDGCIETWFVR